MFAILGLRVLYLLLAGVIHEFHYLKLGLSVVLVFVDAKMLAYIKVPIGISPGVIGGVLLSAVVASLMFPKAAAAHDLVVHDPLERRPPGPVYAPLDADDVAGAGPRRRNADVSAAAMVLYRTFSIGAVSTRRGALSESSVVMRTATALNLFMTMAMKGCAGTEPARSIGASLARRGWSTT